MHLYLIETMERSLSVVQQGVNQAIIDDKSIKRFCYQNYA